MLHSLEDFFIFVQQTKVKPVILYLRAGQINCRVMLGKVIILTMGISVIKRAS